MRKIAADAKLELYLMLAKGACTSGAYKGLLEADENLRLIQYAEQIEASILNPKESDGMYCKSYVLLERIYRDLIKLREKDTQAMEMYSNFVSRVLSKATRKFEVEKLIKGFEKYKELGANIDEEFAGIVPNEDIDFIRSRHKYYLRSFYERASRVNEDLGLNNTYINALIEFARTY